MIGGFVKYLVFLALSFGGCAPSLAQTFIEDLRTDKITFDNQGSTPSTPAASKSKLYFKSDGKLYRLSSAGVETEVGLAYTFGSVGSSPNSAGGSISGSTITLQPADGSNPGLMLSGSQTFGGAKTWNGGQNLESFLEFGTPAQPATTGDDQTLALPSKVVSILGNSALNSVAGVVAPSNARSLIFVNSSGESIVWRHNSGSASVGNKIAIGGGADYTQPTGSAIHLVYDTALGVWVLLQGGGAVTGVTSIANGGTGQTTKAAAFDALSPMTTAGDLIYGGASGTGTRLAVGTTGRALVAGSPPTYFDAGAGRVVYGGASGQLASDSGFVFANSSGVRSLSVTSGSNDARWLSDGTDIYFGSYSAHNLRMLTNTTTRLMISSDGDIGIGTTPVSGRSLAIQRNPGSSTTPIQVLDIAANTTADQYIIQFTRSTFSAELGKIHRNGTGDSVVYATSSDQRLKSDFKSFDALSLLKKTKVYDFKWKSSDQRNYGFKAQELRDAIPSLVMKGDSGKKIKHTWSVDLPGMVPILTKAAQELSEKVDALEKRVKELEGSP